MNIYVMRHGQASAFADTDAQRPLTSFGKKEAFSAGQWLLQNNIVIDNIWVSPYIRAQETCAEVVRALKTSVSPQTVSIITPDDNAVDVHNFIDGGLKSHAMKGVLIISHMPLVSYLVAELTGHQSSPIFQTSGICEISYDEEKMLGELTRKFTPAL